MLYTNFISHLHEKLHKKHNVNRVSFTKYSILSKFYFYMQLNNDTTSSQLCTRGILKKHFLSVCISRIECLATSYELVINTSVQTVRAIFWAALIFFSFRYPGFLLTASPSYYCIKNHKTAFINNNQIDLHTFGIWILDWNLSTSKDREHIQ